MNSFFNYNSKSASLLELFDYSGMFPYTFDKYCILEMDFNSALA